MLRKIGTETENDNKLLVLQLSKSEQKLYWFKNGR